jgi:hypothetical protein
MPFLPARHAGQGNVTIIAEHAIGREWPWNDISEVTDDLPVRKDLLDLFCVGQLQGPKD